MGTISQNLCTNASIEINPVATRKEVLEKEISSTLRYPFITNYHKEKTTQHFRTHQ